MATWQILLNRKAQKYLSDLSQKNPNDAKAIEQAFTEMLDNPWSGDTKKLKGVDGYRRRVRNYRIVFRTNSAKGEVLIEAIDLHHHAY
jgi:mRNA-degrading endonuclease RelE of RelBE toxin-antitoxin system